MKKPLFTFLFFLFSLSLLGQEKSFSFENIGFELPNGEIGSVQKNQGQISISSEMIKIKTEINSSSFEIIHASEKDGITTYVVREFGNEKLNSCNIIFDSSKNLITCYRTKNGLKMGEIYYLKK